MTKSIPKFRATYQRKPVPLFHKLGYYVGKELVEITVFCSPQTKEKFKLDLGLIDLELE